MKHKDLEQAALPLPAAERASLAEKPLLGLDDPSAGPVPEA